MNDPRRLTQGMAVHREYYAQFVTQEIRQIVERQIGFGPLKDSTDEHFNDIPLLWWDSVGHHIRWLVEDQLKEAGDSVTKSTLVCVAKEAGRQILEIFKAQQQNKEVAL
jgi:hypothetical protein